MSRHVVISGCSGGGKSTLLAAFAERGFATVEEPGRRIVREGVLPWVDMAGFARRAVQVAAADLALAPAGENWVFFDRGLVDAAVALRHFAGEDAGMDLRVYHHRVFLTPPWPEIYVADAERQHDFAAAVAEYARLSDAYSGLGYDVVEVPKVPVSERVGFVLSVLGVE